MASTIASHGVVPKKVEQESGREGLEYSTEADMAMVSLATSSFLPNLVGTNSHHQLRDCFALSSINPNYAYMTCATTDARGSMLRCVDLRSGEFRSVGRLWNLSWSVHCVCTGFGYVAIVTSNEIVLAGESNWRHWWSRKTNLEAGMLNSCVLTKLLAGEDENGNTSAEEVVLIVASNGGAVYTLAIPKTPEEKTMLIDVRPGDETFATSEVDQTGVPEGKKRVLIYVPKPEIEIRQILRRTGPGLEFPHIQNINCVVQGKGMYTDYLIGAPDYEKRLLIFIRQYGNVKVAFREPPPRRYYYNEEPEEREEVLLQAEEAYYSTFELIEQQRNQLSLILPIKTTIEDHTEMSESHSASSSYSDDDSEEETRWRSFNAPGNLTVNSLNLAWAPWHHRSILAAGTDSDELIIYDFDEAHRLMCDHEPQFEFDAANSISTILFHKRFKQPVRLLKFSPLPSVPILAVADMTNQITFINCGRWEHVEKIKLPGLVTGMSWSLDASCLYVVTTSGCVKVKTKIIPSLADQVLLSIVKAKLFDADPPSHTPITPTDIGSTQNSTQKQSIEHSTVTPEDLESLDGGADLKERLDLLQFGFLLRNPESPSDITISWPDEDYVNPPIRLKGSVPDRKTDTAAEPIFAANAFLTNLGRPNLANIAARPGAMWEANNDEEPEEANLNWLNPENDPLGDDPAEEDDLSD